MASFISTLAEIEVDRFLIPGSSDWWAFSLITLLGRTTDLYSTWVGTPELTLEANPVARRLGWRFGIPFNILLAFAFGCWPLLAISLTTTSFLVSARNFQYAWMMRVMGEANYRRWVSECVYQSRWGVVIACHLAEAGFFAVLGACLMLFAEWRLVPFGIGLGITGYSAAVAFYTSLSLWRVRG